MPTKAGRSKDWGSRPQNSPVKKKNTKKKLTHKVNWAEKVVAKMGKNRNTLDWFKCYLDSCTTYHTFLHPKSLTDIKEGDSVMNGRCNAGVTSINKQGMYGNFKVWLNERGIANLLSIPTLEEDGYIVTTHTNGKWVVISLEEKRSSSSVTRVYANVCPTLTSENRRKGGP